MQFRVICEAANAHNEESGQGDEKVTKRLGTQLVFNADPKDTKELGGKTAQARLVMYVDGDRDTGFEAGKAYSVTVE